MVSISDRIKSKLNLYFIIRLLDSLDLFWFSRASELAIARNARNVTKSKRKPPRCNFRLNVCVRVIFLVRSRVAVFVTLRRRVRRTLYDL